jgi:uncharacterized protein
MPWRDDETILGPTQRLTPEGFLLCKDVPIARTGEQLYHASELPGLDMPDGVVRVMRDAAEVFDPASIASFQGKPIVDEHPLSIVDPDNIAAHQIGTVTNVRRGDGVLLADLLFTTRRGIDLVRNGKRAVSVGYDAAYQQTGPDTAQQRRIRCNHIALVDEARCGPVCSIGDSARRRSMTRDESMPMPSGISPDPTPIDPRTGIPMTWTAGMSIDEITRAWRVNDARRSNKLLREWNQANAKFWEQRR